MSGWRRGACPGLTTPMPTGDGLLARFMPLEPMALDVWQRLCEASLQYGNGIMEVSQRGSLQIRGLTSVSAPEFARALAASGLPLDNRPPLLTAPLLGLGAGEDPALCEFVRALRTAISTSPLPSLTSPKLSVLIDGPGALHLDQIVADVRVRAAASGLHLALAGAAASATALGWVKPGKGVTAVIRILRSLAARGPGARARDLVQTPELGVLRCSLADLLVDGPPPESRAPVGLLGHFRLRDDRLARGFALPFGYAGAGALKTLGVAATRLGAEAIRPAPGRGLLVLGLNDSAACALAEEAQNLELVVDAHDVRRQVVACAGAPACSSARFDTRGLAQAIAGAMPSLEGEMTVHISGCPKGCAHPGVAVITLVGPDRLVLQGKAGDLPHGHVTAADFLARLRQWAAVETLSIRQMCAAEQLARTGIEAAVASFGGAMLP